MSRENVESDDTAVDPNVSVADDERLYRRIAPTWYHPDKPITVAHAAFLPRRWKSDDDHGDADGLSVNRAKYTTVQSASIIPHSGKPTHLVEFGVTDTRRAGMTVRPDPLANDRSHAVIPELNSLDYRDPEKKIRIQELAMALRDRSRIVFEAPRGP